MGISIPYPLEMGTSISYPLVAGMVTQRQGDEDPAAGVDRGGDQQDRPVGGARLGGLHRRRRCRFRVRQRSSARQCLRLPPQAERDLPPLVAHHQDFLPRGHCLLPGEATCRRRTRASLRLRGRGARQDACLGAVSPRSGRSVLRS